jgi:hypothetical protein
MTQKLFYVEVTKSGWVLADDEPQARTFEQAIMDTEYLKDVNATPYNHIVLKESGWNKDCLVYHKDQRNKDIKLGDVLNDR